MNVPTCVSTVSDGHVGRGVPIGWAPAEGGAGGPQHAAGGQVDGRLVVAPADGVLERPRGRTCTTQNLRPPLLAALELVNAKFMN